MRNLSLSPVAEFALVVAILAFGKPVLVPVALAFYLAFILTPPVDWLERLGLPRVLSVTSVVAAAIAAVTVFGSVLVSQAADLGRQMKTYSVQMNSKLAALRTGKMGVVGDLQAAISDLGRSFDPDVVRSEDSTPVRVVSDGFSTFERLEHALGPLVKPVSVTIVVLVMAIFVLSHREDLRGRLIQLVGTQNVTVTTRTLAEAVRRVGHMLLTQAYINAGFGTVVALGLRLIGVPYALLWGVMAGLLRFVPLLGVVIATLLPSLAAFAIFPGFREAVLTVGLFLVVDALVANFLEPMVLGKRTGVSALALLISALFWAWIWGPTGLFLATPLTVCAAVIGRHVPQLSFLSIALGDEPGLNPEVEFYQRTLARATKDAFRLARRRLATSSLAETFDDLLVPALALMVNDQNLQTISNGIADRVVKDMAEIVDRLAAVESGRPLAQLPSIVAVPAESEADVLLLKMLQASAAEQGAAVLPVARANRAQTLQDAVQGKPAVVCIAALPPGSNANARFLCRRLRALLPEARLVVLLPEPMKRRSREAAARLREAGADAIAYGVREATRVLLDPRALSASLTPSTPPETPPPTERDSKPPTGGRAGLLT